MKIFKKNQLRPYRMSKYILSIFSPNINYVKFMAVTVGVVPKTTQLLIIIF